MGMLSLLICQHALSALGSAVCLFRRRHKQPCALCSVVNSDFVIDELVRKENLTDIHQSNDFCLCLRAKLDVGFFTCSQTIPNRCNRFVVHSMCEVITKVIRCVCRLRLLAPLYLLCAIHTIRIGQCKAGKSSH